jgi:hypothetical protein
MPSYRLDRFYLGVRLNSHLGDDVHVALVHSYVISYQLRMRRILFSIRNWWNAPNDIAQCPTQVPDVIPSRKKKLTGFDRRSCIGECLSDVCILSNYLVHRWPLQRITVSLHISGKSLLNTKVCTLVESSTRPVLDDSHLCKSSW